MQEIQNAAAKIITNSRKYDHVTPILKKLHWLPVEPRIKFKIAIITYKCIKGKAPSYLRSLIKSYKPSRSLRSQEQDLLIVPRTNTKTLGTKAFYFAAPTIWNELPLEVRRAKTSTSFKTKLKTYLFKSHFKD